MKKSKTFYTLLVIFLTIIRCYCQNYYKDGCAQYFNGKDDKVAIELFTKAIENNQEIAKSYMMRGAAKTYLSDFIGALTDLETSLKLDSSNYKTYLYYGRVYFAQGFFNTAIQYYNIAISINPNDAEVYDNRAIAKGKLGDYVGAIIDESNAIRINPSKVEYLNNRGFAKLELKQYEEAIIDFNLVIKNGNNPQAYANRGIAFAGLGKHHEAIEDFTKGIEKMPKAKDMHYLRGISFKAVGMEKEACSDFAKSVEMGYEPAKIEQKNYCLNK